MILAMSSTGWPLAGLLSAITALAGFTVAAVKVGDKAGQFEEHLTNQDKALSKQDETLAKQDAVLDQQSVELARQGELLDSQKAAFEELRDELKALRSQQ